jgi:hypothetical protein
MTEVTLSQGVLLVLLFAVHGHIRPIGGSQWHGWGVPVAHRLARGLHVSLGQCGSKPRGSGTFDDATGPRARRRDVARGAHLARDLSARLGWDRVCRLYRKRLTCCPRFR